MCALPEEEIFEPCTSCNECVGKLLDICTIHNTKISPGVVGCLSGYKIKSSEDKNSKHFKINLLRERGTYSDDQKNKAKD